MRQVLLMLLMTVFLSAAVCAQSVNLENQTVITPRLSVTIAPSGAPAQVHVHPTVDEVPLERRSDPSQLSAGELAAIGRGPQLRGPIRLVVHRDGRAHDVAVDRPAEPTLDGDAVTADATLSSGATKIELKTQYDSNAWHVTMAFTGGEVEAIEWVIELASLIDLIVPGDPIGQQVRIHDAGAYALNFPGEGLVWGNATEDAARSGVAMPGLLHRLFVGDGDRGFTFSTDGQGGWAIDPRRSMSVVEQDQAGQLIWRIRVVNHELKIDDTREVSFTLAFHPSRARPAEYRRAQWLNWPASAVAAQRAGSDASHVLLAGPAGAQGVSATEHHARTFPLPLVRYLAGTHAGRAARIAPRNDELTVAGASQAPDRTVLGRAILLDVGVDAAGLADPGQALSLLAALERFGYFKSDAGTEFLPYWRSGSVARFGEEVAADSEFNDPDSEQYQPGVYLSVYRRPITVNGKSGYETLFVIVNERDRPVRRRLYIFDPQKLLGGAVKLRRTDALGHFDLSVMPEGSDHRIGRYLGGTIVLEDVQTHAIVQQSPSEGQQAQIFGPVYVDAWSYRVLRAFSYQD